jgi:hypothetical protein
LDSNEIWTQNGIANILRIAHQERYGARRAVWNVRVDVRSPLRAFSTVERPSAKKNLQGHLADSPASKLKLHPGADSDKPEFWNELG